MAHVGTGAALAGKVLQQGAMVASALTLWAGQTATRAELPVSEHQGGQQR